MDTNQMLRSAGVHRVLDHDEFAAAANRAQFLEGQGKSAGEIMSAIVAEFVEGKIPSFTMRSAPAALTMWGKPDEDFDWPTVEQINVALSLPVAVRGALLPDAHVGYALPVGGVVALNRAVSPSFVGFDIACRMTMTILDEAPGEVMARRRALFDAMKSVSAFGVGAHFEDGKREHPVMDDPAWGELATAKQYKAIAGAQLGTSGGGNHFFDLMIGSVEQDVAWLPLKKGNAFAAIVTHSGSRGTGHKLATHYGGVAKAETQRIARAVPKGYEWLSIDTDAGREYLAAMELMGKYAQANHHLIHDHFCKATGIRPLVRYENHHNFAWVEGDLVIHRKGATPARKGEVGIIPGSSGSESFLVEGLGNEATLESSSHGAGRLFSRTEAKRRHSAKAFADRMAEWDVLYDGVAPDETFEAYKDIRTVIGRQEGALVRTIARMRPVAVLMGGRADDGD